MALSISKISKRFDNRWVLRDVSFEIEEGEVFGIFGPSGGGKSVLLDIIGRKETADTGGSVAYGVRDTGVAQTVHRCCPVRRSIWHTLFGRHEELPTTGEGRLLSLEAFLNDASDLRLLDDPFHGMDWQLRTNGFKKIKAAAGENGTTVVFASNDYRDIMAVCDRVAVLVGGEVKQVGTPQHVYENPASVAVARCVERNNLFDARRLTSSKSELPEYQTIAGSHRLFAQKIKPSALAPINQTVTLGIRPEQVSLSFGASFPEDNLIRATVAGIEFLGPTTAIKFDSEGLLIEALVLRVVGLKIGDECMVGLPPERIQVFKD